MPIRIPDGLPAKDVLLREGVSVMDESAATRQDIRPLRIALLNLMPNKITTETQIARLIGSTPLQVELTLVRIGSHQANNTSEEHLINFYSTFDEMKHQKFDGFIITGAPVERLPFEEVTYWDELSEILDWTTTHVHSSFFVCWGAMAAAWHLHPHAAPATLQSLQISPPPRPTVVSLRADRSPPKAQTTPQSALIHARPAPPLLRSRHASASHGTDGPAPDAPAGHGGSHRYSSWLPSRPPQSNLRGLPAPTPDGPSSPALPTTASARPRTAPPAPAPYRHPAM